MGMTIIGEGLPSRFQTASRFQHALTGGGTKIVDAGAIAWNTRFIAISQQKSSNGAVSGYFQIDMPPDGTVIPSGSGGTSLTVAAGRIPLTGWQALWYIPPWGSTATSLPANFRVTYYNDASVEIPDDWVLVCMRHGDISNSPSVRWGTGDLDDHWRTISFANGWTNYQSGFNPTGVRFDRPGCVRLKGLVRGGTAPHIFTLPVGMRPPSTELRVVATDPNVFGRVDIGVDGGVTMPVGSNGWLSLDGITFDVRL